MFERYTERARRVLFFARYEASQFGSTTIETEHFLLGLIREDKHLTNRFFRGSSSPENIRGEIKQRMTIREKVSTSTDLPLSNECKRILAYAGEESERLHHRHIGTEHVLLGILREEKCVAADILQERGLHLDTLREQVSRSVADRQSRVDALQVDAPRFEQPQKGAMVPDAATAKLIAQAIWTPVYGADVAAIGDSMDVVRSLGFWRVTGGGLFAFIRSIDGQVLAMGQKARETDV